MILIIELIKKFKYNVILCDIKMPKMDGMELLEKIKEISQRTCIIMMTGFGTVETAVKYHTITDNAKTTIHPPNIHLQKSI